MNLDASRPVSELRNPRYMLLNVTSYQFFRTFPHLFFPSRLIMTRLLTFRTSIVMFQTADISHPISLTQSHRALFQFRLKLRSFNFPMNIVCSHSPSTTRGRVKVPPLLSSRRSFSPCIAYRPFPPPRFPSSPFFDRSSLFPEPFADLSLLLREASTFPVRGRQRSLQKSNSPRPQ